MKKISLIVLSCSLFFACSSSDNSNNNDQVGASTIEFSDDQTAEPKFEFEHETWDFGTITDGDRVEHTFKFKNSGNANLVIADVNASCGCTIPSWTTKPIEPGEEGKIKVEFNSAGKSGQVSKDITILANTVPVKTKLRIKVFVEK